MSRYSKKALLAYQDFECNECFVTIYKEDPFYFFNKRKVCSDCYRRLLDLRNSPSDFDEEDSLLY